MAEGNATSSWTAPSRSQVPSSSTPSSGHPAVKLTDWVGDVTSQSRAPAQGLGGAAQAYQAGVPGGPTSTGPPHCVVLAGATKVASSELGCLAASLAASATGRVALQAAAAACEAAGVASPTDLALAGSGDDLPQDTVDLILGGCGVSGVQEALEVLFKNSRDGLVGTLALQSRRRALGLQGPALPAPAPVRMALGEPRAVQQVKTALSGSMLPPSKQPRRATGADRSLRTQEEGKFKAAVARCFAQLEEIGTKSPRYLRVMEARRVRSDGTLRLQENTFIGRFSSDKSLDCARRKFESFMIFFQGLKLDPFALSEWDTAAWIADQANRGKSGPKRAIHALAWAEKAYEVNLSISSPLIQAQRSTGSSSKDVTAPKPARMATVQMLKNMEDLVHDAPSSLLKCWAGVFAALGHGVLRWADLQHSQDIKITSDAVFGSTWRMKGKRIITPWAALRKGFAGRDWGGTWITQMAKEELPGVDFVIRAPNSTWTGFQERIASFHDAQAALRSLLVISGMELGEAMTFTCHSWRHLYPTAGKQLDMPPDSIDDMGRWQHGTGMSGVYDSRACVSELLQKTKVVSAVVGGWSLVDPGCVPRSPPQPPHHQPPHQAREPQQRRARQRAEPAQPVGFVLHTGKGRLHAYAGGDYPVCKQWRCGSQDRPVPDALFASWEEAELLVFNACRSCASQHRCEFPEPSSSRASPARLPSVSSSSSSISSA